MTADIWTDRNMCGFLGVTSWSRKRQLLGENDIFTGSHTRKRINEVWTEKFLIWKFLITLLNVICNNSTNMKRVLCFAVPIDGYSWTWGRGARKPHRVGGNRRATAKKWLLGRHAAPCRISHAILLIKFPRKAYKHNQQSIHQHQLKKNFLLFMKEYNFVYRLVFFKLL